MFHDSMRVWSAAARPRTLPAAAAPVILGAALAGGDGVFHAAAALAALLGAMAIQIAANYANDYYDFLKGADTQERIGPQRATQAGLVTPGQMRNATAAALLFAVPPGVYLIYRGGWPILLIGLLSMAFAVLYTGGPLPLGYIGIADLFVLVFFGPVAVAGTYYVQARALPWMPVLVGLAPGLISTAILTVNNLRDVDQDRRAGKKTLAVRFGIAYARLQYCACMTAALVAIPLTVAFISGRYFVLAVLLTLPAALACMRTVNTLRDGAALNQCLARTGQILLAFSLLFSAGWLAA